MKQSYSLFELNEYIRRVVALNFPESIWINCEISQISASRNHRYLELIEQNEAGEITAQISAAIWYRNFLFIKNKLGQLAEDVLQTGSHVLLKVEVDFNERYGLKLSIVDIDPGYTLGKLEISRQEILQKLKHTGDDNRNARHPIPMVPQRIAVISSSTAAGYMDFVQQCRVNQYGYTFDLTLFDSAVQGMNTEHEVCAAFAQIEARAHEFDAVVLIRGGGSKIDLSHFDNLNIALKIAHCSLPVFTGIGHETDQSISDIVAHSAFKTPTAVASFLIDRMLAFESRCCDIIEQVHTAAKRRINDAKNQLDKIETAMSILPMNAVHTEALRLSHLWENILKASKAHLNSSRQHLAAVCDSIQYLDPKNLLDRGYTYVTQNKKIIPRKSMIKPGVAVIHFADGEQETHLNP